MKVAFSTLGCRVNVYESEAMIEKFIKDGYEITNFEEFSDVYVINTCTVTNMGDKKSRQMISRARRKNPEAIIAVVGCYSQIASDEISKIEGVDVVLGTRNKGDIVYYVNRAREEKKQFVEVSDVLRNKNFEELDIEEYQDKTRAFLKIQDGCNKFCSYCLIPFARGAVCSKDPEKLLKEVHELAQNGFKEIILSGVHTASYGVDLEGDWSLVKILEEINKVEGIERIRIGSIDPTFFSEGVIEKITTLEKMCPHFHLSLQSGCDATLKRMNRHYTTEDYKTVVKNLRKYISDVSITTDIIAGFPGESERDFNETYKFLSEIKLSKMHIFKYSPRKGTKAAEMMLQVDGNIKEQRSEALITLAEKLENEFMNKFIGRTMNVLYEEESKDLSNHYVGYTPNYIKVITKSDENLQGKIVETRLKEVDKGYILGEI
ncbi:radical SAM methylthiotransferase, MiaB/RimO family protein [Clostridium argentinense CDC 2741]|uniref:Threonylcarbamoyladenosine tRNA methylthiotransferase MtaB n=1 Tax=Clostridium argentinense CDC 2741 TaxID=1418104 RepID=A0A0C1UJ06_9CLOT|nr:tRNA (N(6)-L-threonylcarbamoyladenosine(37)-C(2))-methylthiotransferase MtaB [Clostridium argentinense]ARC85531.1 tRNA (N(6)-L-threonylcarbamoyladenosine(37)-C(2))-methylthiotransferase MtaB [Clostridium argentinense]KIE47270.1 radical SAM methylthiotransferase, MiaB/RimO family protein [Clostridium argentinense CDC 2741]NFF40045.1 tRNA (N(6)-L-threonylcarbamoyladenosine(37)-C(2))-methylthiotransferase MtaB [Clostridium argentinense]NFP50255.1 tRNA (N(6)-L-threonylcarbamoyladenosine(37)-C(2)